jgi:dTDP-4-amino-4,6-dideoxygalactose transaminase
MTQSHVRWSAIDFASCGRENADLAELIEPQSSRVAATGKLLQGPETEALEAELAAICRRKYAICVGSGTDALFFALLSQGIGPGDQVLVPDLSFIATASAVLRTGATPVFVDIDSSCNLDLDRASALVSHKTKAVLYVQLFGGMGDVDRLEQFGASQGLRIIEDGAQSLGASYAGRACGSVGHVSALSFDPTKVLSALGSGGAVLTDDEKVALRARRLRYHGRQDGEYVELGYNSQLSEISAAILRLKLGLQAHWTSKRQAVAQLYLDAFAGLPLTFPSWPAPVEHVWHKFTLQHHARDRLRDHLRVLRIPTLIHYPHPFHREALFGCSSDHDFPRASFHADHSLSLPIHAYLSDDEIGETIDAVKSFF